MPDRAASSCLYDSIDWLHAWENIGIEDRTRHAYVVAHSPGPGGKQVLPLYVVKRSPFWHGYELQAGLSGLCDGAMVFAGSTYSMYSKRGVVLEALVRGAHATAMDWMATGEANLLIVPNLTEEGVASWVRALGPPAGQTLLDRTYHCELSGTFTDHLHRLDPKIRRDVTRRLRRAEERGVRVDLLEGELAHELVRAALPLTVGTTDEHGWPPLYDEATLHGLLRVRGAMMVAARAGNRLVGVFFAFRYGDEAVFLCGGVDYSTLREFSTYIVLMYRCTEWAYEQDLRRIEWGRDNYRFKERHGLTGTDLWALVYAPPGGSGPADELAQMHKTMCAYVGAG